MSDWFEEIINKIQSINSKIDSYKESSVIQSLPSVAYVNRAKKCIEEGRLKDALDILQEAESLPQEDALVYKYKGMVYDDIEWYVKFYVDGDGCAQVMVWSMCWDGAGH